MAGAGLPQPGDFGVDYITLPNADMLFVRVSDPVLVTLQDLGRRLQTRPGICWWAKPDECMDLRDIPLDTVGSLDLGEQIRSVIMASPFVEEATVYQISPSPDSDSLVILCEVETAYGKVLRISFTATGTTLVTTLIGESS